MASALSMAKVAGGSVAGLVLAFTGLVGFAHTKPGRPLLGVLKPALTRMARAGGGSRCPFGYDAKATPEQREAERNAFAGAHSGSELAAAKPALGFALDRSTSADVQSWAASHGVACHDSKGAKDLECKDVPDTVLPAGDRGASLSSLWFTFGAQGTLTSVVAVRNSPSAEAIGAAFAAVKADVEAHAGPAASTVGEGTAADLAAGLLRQSTAEFRFQNYYAVARAANVGHGFVLTEEYRSLAD
jgi:hypothetical protein